MSGQLFRRLEKFRKQRALSILKLCKEIGCNNVTYHRWKKTQAITGPYKKIIEELLDKNETRHQSPAPTASDIAVIGIACYYPGASSVKELWENILARRVQFRRILDQRLPLNDYHNEDPKFPDKSYLTKAAFIDGFEFNWSKLRIPRKTFESTDIVHWLALDTALRALEDAGYKLEDMPKENTGVIVGNTLTGEQTRSQTLRLRWPFVRKTLDVTLAKLGLQPQERQNIEAAMEGIYKSAFYPITEDSLAGGLANTIAGRICNYFNFKGGGYIVDGACSSSLLAIATAANALKNGELDIALAGGVDISLDPFELVGFSKAGALAKDKMRVYDRGASGFIPGEGCGFVILKRLEDAVRDGNYIYAVVKGWGISSDGKGGIMEPSTSGQALAIERAYKNVPYKITDINFIEGHGTGTAKGDRVELEGIATAMAKEAPKDLKRIYGITSFKSIVGHTKAAAGIGGFIKAVLAVNQRILPPTANCRQPNETFESVGKCLYPVTQGVILDAVKPVRGGISSAGFGGINCHIAIESKDQPKQGLKPSVDERALLVSNQETEVFVFASQTVSLLKNLIGKFKDDLRFISQAEMADLGARLTKNIKKNAPVKVAVVTDSPENLYQALCLIEEELSKGIPEGEILKIKSPNPNIRIFLGNRTKQARIGFLYPGQASQRLNMTRTLFERFAWARDLAAVTKTPIAQYIYKPLDQFLTAEERSGFEKELSRTEITQPAVTFSSLVWTEFLAKLGIEPDAIGGHSLGELSAFYKAGALTKDELLKFAEFRGQTMVASGKDKGAMASLGCSYSKAEELVRRVKGNLVTANINSPVQTVISGDKSDIEKVIQEAKKEDIVGVLLPVSDAFHSSFMKESCARIKSAKILSRSFKPSKTALYSCMNGDKLTGSVQLNEYFSQQVISPVRFIDLVESMSKECDLLIEVGPGRVLADLVKAINKEKGPACLSVESTVGNDKDLNFVLAELFVRNISIRWEELYKNRLIRPFVPVSKRKFIVNQCERPLKVSENIGKITVDHEKIIQGVVQSMAPAIVGEETPGIQSSQESLPSPNGRVSDTLIHFVEKLTGFNKDSIQLNLRLLDDLNLDSIKAAELIAEVAKSLGVAGEIEPAQYSNKTLEEIRQKFEELLREKRENKPHKTTQQDILKRYAKDVWVRNFIEKFEPETVNDKNPDIFKSLKNVLVICEDSEREIAGKLEEGLKDVKVRIVTADEVNMEENPECVITILRSDGEGWLSEPGLHQVMERLQKIISAAANSKHVLFAQIGLGDFKNSNIRALASTLHLERPDLRLKIIDFNQTLSSQFIADKIQEELQVNSPFAIAGYTSKGQRQAPVFEVSNPACYKARNIHWSKKDVVLVTGGAKGITAECALEFARATQAKMVLLGRSAKDEEIEKTLERFNAEKLVCEYFSCDVTNVAQVKQIVKDIEKKFGQITAVIHGAGLNSLRRLKQANLEDVCKEALPKVMGAVHVLDALEGRPLKLFAAMASIIGVTGMEGSGWYGFANEILIGYLRQYKRAHNNIEIIAPAFSVWDEVGMGIKLGSVAKLSERGIGAIPVAEGVKRFRDLIEKDPGVEQVIITSRVPGLDTLRLKEFKPSQAWRFIENIKYYIPGVELINRAHLNTKDDPYVLDHNWKGSLLFPLVFGLEAMTEAACYLLGVQEVKSLRFKDINLERAISVSEQSGTLIEIHALAFEDLGTKKVKVEIFCEQTNFKEPHFAAIVELNPPPKAAKYKVISREKLKTPIGFDLETDIYGPILFQGKMFQCIDKIHELFYSTKVGKGGCLFISEDNRCRGDFFKTTQKYGNRLLIGDPFLVDSLLQSMQLIVAQEACLPNLIKEVEIGYLNQMQPRWGFIVKSSLEKISDRFLNGNAEAFYNNNAVIKIKDCRLKIIDHVSNNPPANDLVNPVQRDSKAFSAFIKRVSEIGHLILPEIYFTFWEGFAHKNKVQRRLIIKQWLRKLGYKGRNEIHLAYLRNSKPIIKSPQGGISQVSISHKGSYLLLSMGKTSQGIDIEDIQKRDINEWHSILNITSKSILDQLLSVGTDLNIAGTCAWSVVESLYKAINQSEDEINYEGSTNGIYMFSSGLLGEDQRIISGLIELTRGRPKICTFIVNLQSSGERSLGLQEQISSDSLKSLGFATENLCGINAEYRGPQDQLVFKCHFPVTFKHNQLFSKNVYFTNYFDFCGTLREYSVFPILKDFLNTAKVGKASMITKMTSLDIYKPVQIGDIIEGRLWMERLKGQKKSTMNMFYEWHVINRGKAYKVADCRQDTIWVKLDHAGKAEIDEYPHYLKEFTNLMEPRTTRGRLSERKDNKSFDVYSGDELNIFEPHLPNKYKVHQKLITATLENSNLLSNIYFSSYAKWIGQLSDEYFYKCLPDFYSDYSGRKEIFCPHCSIDYTNECFPFDQILIEMFVNRVFEKGIEMHFEFYKIKNDKKVQKLAYGKQQILFVSILDNGMTALKTPDKLIKLIEGLRA